MTSKFQIRFNKIRLFVPLKFRILFFLFFFVDLPKNGWKDAALNCWYDAIAESPNTSIAKKIFKQNKEITLNGVFFFFFKGLWRKKNVILKIEKKKKVMNWMNLNADLESNRRLVWFFVRVFFCKHVTEKWKFKGAKKQSKRKRQKNNFKKASIIWPSLNV